MADTQTHDLGIAGLGPAVKIGSGGFADVYRAQQTNLHREVAVKVLRAPASDGQARMRFERECQAMGSLSAHPNIVSVHEGAFTDDGRAYLVMEYFPGGSLQDRMQRDGPFPAAEVIEIGVKIGRALGVAHEGGVLHRDVKPANILVSTYGEPALADFGIARVEGGQHTATGQITASFAHAAPEVLEGEAPSPASDLYSLASTMFELFVGRPPHVRPEDQSMWALVNRVLTSPIPDPTSLGMPEPLAGAIVRATARQPTARHQGATELVAHLSTPVSVPPKPVPSNPAPVTVVGREGPVAFPSSSAPTSSVSDTTTYPAEQVVAGRPQHPNSVAFGERIPTGPISPKPAPVEAAGIAGGTGATPPLTAAPTRRRWPLRLGFVLVLALAAAGGWFVVQTFDSVATPAVLTFAEGAEGPLEAGVVYDLVVDGVDDDSRFRLVVDDEPRGEPVGEVPAFEPEPGRHSVAVEVTRGDTVEATEAIEIYAIGEIPGAGFRANLGSPSSGQGRWPATLRMYDRLVDEGHQDLQLLPSNLFPALIPDKWNLFVAGFGEDREAARAYCLDHDLQIPDECFVSRFDPDAT